MLRDTAVSYLARGWSVVPAHTPVTSAAGDVSCSCSRASCASPGKHPRIKWQEYQHRLPEKGEVERWWSRWPEANIAIVTGAVSGLVVVDADAIHGGLDSLLDLRLPDTRISLTGGGGRHLFYKYPGNEIPNAAAVMPGIDIRGDGGYVIAPPSRHVSGRRYLWEVDTLEEPVPFPAGLCELLRTRRPPVGDPGLPHAFDLSAILARRIPHGERDDTLTQIAGHFAGAGDDLADIILKLSGVNTLYCVTADRKRPDPLDQEDIERIARSIFEKEQKRRAQATELQAAVDKRLNGATHDGEDVPDRDRGVLLERAWENVGVKDVAELVLQIGQKDSYVLVVGDEEVLLGEDLFNQRIIRMRILNRLGQAVRSVSAREWGRHAELFRKLAQVQRAEKTGAEEVAEEWEAEFSNEMRPTEVVPEQMNFALGERAVKKEGRIYLRPEVLKRFVESRYGEKVELTYLRKQLRMAGWEPWLGRVGEQVIRAWRRKL